MSKEDAIVWYFCTKKIQRVFASNTNYSVAVSHSIVFQFVTITDSIDLHYYLFNGEDVPQKDELAQMAEHSFRMREVLGSIQRFCSLYRSCNYCLPQDEHVEISRIL